MNSYLEIDFTEIKGFTKLSEGAKEVFIRVYKAHNTVQGREYKEDYQPVKVTEYPKFLKVYFKNGEWLHYYPNGTWG